MAGPLDLPGRLRAWTYHRQRLGRAAAGPGEAVRDVVGVYSSHPTAPLALLGRSAAFDAGQLREMEERRETVRLPGMRLSIFLLPTETAARIFAATRQPIEKRAANLRYAGLDWDEYARLKDRVFEHTQEPITPRALQEAIQIDARLMTVVRFMAYEGLVLRLGTSLRTDSLRYVATATWLGHPLEEADPEDSLRWLAEAYLRGYGPARVADFAWWSGVPKRRAQAALAATNVVDLGGGLLLPADDRDAFASIEPVATDAIAILPKWDAYTMGYAPDGRQRLVEDEHLRRAYSTGGGGTLAGDGLPLILRGGRAVAIWSHRFTGNRMRVEVTPFAPDALPPALYEHAFDAVGSLLDATAIEVVAATVSP